MSGEKTSSNMLARIRSQLLASLEDSVAWFHAEMPAYYFTITDPAEQARHLEIVHALRRAREQHLTMIDDGEARKLLVFGRPDKHGLIDVVHMIGDRPVERMELHTARDRSLFIYAFAYGAGPAPAPQQLAEHRSAILAACAADGLGRGQVMRYLDAVDPSYLARSSVERAVRHITAWSQLTHDDDIHVLADDTVDATAATRVLIAVGGIKPTDLMLQLGRALKRYDLTPARAYLDSVPAVSGEGRALIATVYVSNAAGRAIGKRGFAAIAADLAAIRRQYRDRLAELYQTGAYTLEELELLRAALGFAGQLLAPEHPYLDVGDVGVEAIQGEPAFCKALCDLIAARFKPGATLTAKAWQRRYDKLAKQAHGIESLARATVLEGMLTFVAAIRLTNAYRDARLGLAFKLDPTVLPATRFPHPPFGLFYFAGHHAKGFHVRFRASARGGLRLVLPRNPGQYQRARDQLLKEVYDLAWAQQLKNKDIPEGGSKCIALVVPGGDASAAVKQVVDALLDLIVPAQLCPEVIGAHGEERGQDLIFLGPDENMTPERIVWVADRAKARGLPHPETLMSSKPGAGINHKEYGVTSEGLFRWIDLVLPLAGVAASQPYTVKITGGPDGDLGGNLLRILHREHGRRCKVVAIGDGTGYAHDPNGLDWDELLRLVRESAGIARFDPAKLKGAGARGGAAVDKLGEQIRNTLHNTVVADLFVPCGGRPYTINDQNWRDFLGESGKPSARAMVEGANIFVTPEARKQLEHAGLMVIKDSSANKGGVICSSYEVLAGLLLSDDEFIAVKPRYVAEVIQAIRDRADDEGRALLAAWRRRGRSVALSELSQKLSEEINRVSGLIEPVITAHLDDAEFAPAWRHWLEAHCPPVLVERWRDRIETRIPRAHRVAILAKRLASTMVYREGLTWCHGYVRDERTWQVVATYVSADAQVRQVLGMLSKLDLPNREQLARVIAAGSRREIVRERLGQDY